MTETLTLQLPGITPHDYQELFVGDAMKAIDDGEPGAWHLYAAPTGTGKSVMELMLLGYVPNGVLITPRLEIVAGMLQKGGVDPSGWSDERLAAEALRYRITTPVRFRNMLAAGKAPFRPDVLIVDEFHHFPADTYQDIIAYLGTPTVIGLTATPFRGTPQGTAEFLEKFASITHVLTLPQAAERGCVAVPTAEVWPLVDDDEIRVQGGEIEVRAAGDAVIGVLDEVVEWCRGFIYGHAAAAGGRIVWDRPTLFAVPTTTCCRELAADLTANGLPAEAVTQDTPRQRRNEIFAAAMHREVAVVQIDVVSEGVDLPFRRLIDLRPTMSPVKWQQQLGRITRPLPSLPCLACKGSGNWFDAMGTVYDCSVCDGKGRQGSDLPPEYYCCNRNLERHGYLWGGVLPSAAYRQAQEAFEQPTRRAGVRALGLESIGRFQPAELPFADGLTGQIYNLVAVEGFERTQYACVVHPAHADVLYCVRRSSHDGNGNYVNGTWEPVAALPDLRGFGSAPVKAVTPKQLKRWQEWGGRLGLDPAAEPNRRNVEAVFLLNDLRRQGISLAGA